MKTLASVVSMRILTYLPFNKKVKFYQDDEHIKVSIDSLIISFFSPLKSKIKILDIGTNNGVILLILALRSKALNLKTSLMGIDINKEAIDIAKINFELNNLKAELISNDFKDHKFIEKFNLIVCNPPYFKKDTRTLKNANIISAKQEVLLTINELIIKASKIIENRGKFCLIIAVERLIETIDYLLTNKFFPKIIQPFCSRVNEDISLVYIESIYQGKFGFTMKHPIYINSIKGNQYSKFLQKKFTLNGTANG